VTLRLVLGSLGFALMLVASVALAPAIHKWRVVTFRWQCWKFQRALQQLQVERLDRELAALRSV
jgi:hypothetical protein